MPIATLTSKGQITLPREVREQLHVAAGDRVEFVFGSNGEIRVQAIAGSYRDLQGIVTRRAGTAAPSLGALDDELSRTLAADDARIRRGGR